MTDTFTLQQLTLYNYSSSNEKLHGTVVIQHNRNEMKLEVKMTAEDAAKILEVFADRIAGTVQAAAQAILTEVTPQITHKSEVVEAIANTWDDPIQDSHPKTF